MVEGDSRLHIPWGADGEGHRALRCSTGAASFGDHLRIELKHRHQPTQRRGIELAQRVIDRVAYFAEQRRPKIHGRLPLPPLHMDAGIPIRAADHPSRDADDEPLAERRR